MHELIIPGVITLVILIMYNTLVAKKNQVKNIFAAVDTLLKKRYDLIPNLVAVADRYMQHEKQILEQVAYYRSQAMKPGLGDAETIRLDREVSTALGNVMIAVENYPDLKANEHMMHLQRTLTEIEAQISAARRAYNQAVTDYNNLLEMIPTNFLAYIMGYKRRPLFELQSGEGEVTNVRKLFR